MRTTITFRTTSREEIVDITAQVQAVVSKYGKDHELCALYALGATAAIMIQENWDPNIQTDVLNCLRSIAPEGQWLHDRIDGNGAAHMKAGLVGPSEIVPIQDRQLLLSKWQNVFLCDFDGPRASRKVIVTLI